MTANDNGQIHSDKELFRDSVLFTAKETGFSANLIEKDYYCSLVLMRVYGDLGVKIAFKGGTSLSKCHTDFFRMSEDLDFMIPMPPESTRKQRSKAMECLREKWESNICLAPFKEISALKGHNSSLQYVGELEYDSLLTGATGRIKMEIGLREELLSPTERRVANTILINPFTGRHPIQAIPVETLSLIETYAEKMRAALTRREPAIRDYFDLDYAYRIMGLDFFSEEFLKILKRKLMVSGIDPVDISEEKQNILLKQVEGALKPVLREKDFLSFDLDRIFKIVIEITRKAGI